MPCGFAGPRWQVRLRESVPLAEGKPAGVHRADRCGQLRLFLEPSKRNYPENRPYWSFSSGLKER